jgi:hypothetical protein
MSNKTTWVSVALALLFGVSLFAAAETPDVGQKAPDFTLSTPEGHPLNLSGLTSKGTVVLIVLRGFPGYQCPYCQRQVHDFVTNSDRFAAFGVQVLLVYPGPPADLDRRAKEFLAKQERATRKPASGDRSGLQIYEPVWPPLGRAERDRLPNYLPDRSARRGVFSQDQPGSWRSNHCGRRACGVGARKSRSLMLSHLR